VIPRRPAAGSDPTPSLRAFDLLLVVGVAIMALGAAAMTPRLAAGAAVARRAAERVTVVELTLVAVLAAVAVALVVVLAARARGHGHRPPTPIPR